jgi:hypothetical protein
MPAASASLLLRPAQRLRVQAVLAVSAQLIRCAGGNLQAEGLDCLIGERRRLLRELRNGIDCPRELGCFEAMAAAVDESDRALRRIMNDEAACSRASTP